MNGREKYELEMIRVICAIQGKEIDQNLSKKDLASLKDKSAIKGLNEQWT